MPAVLNREVLDEIVPVDDEDAIDDCRADWRAARASSPGSRAAPPLYAALEIARRPESKGKRIVTVLPDSGERYVSTPFFAP